VLYSAERGKRWVWDPAGGVAHSMGARSTIEAPLEDRAFFAQCFILAEVALA